MNAAPAPARQCEMRDVPGKFARRAVVQLELDRHRLPEHGSEVDVRIGRLQIELEAKRAPELLVPAAGRGAAAATMGS